MSRPPAFPDELLEMGRAMLAERDSRFTEPKYSTPVAFAAAGVSERDGRRWLDRGIVKPDDSGAGRSKFRFSVATTVNLAIMSRVVRLGMSPAEGWQIGELCGKTLRAHLNTVFARALRDIGGSGLFFHIARDATGGIVIARSQHPEIIAEEIGDAAITIDLLKIARAVCEGLGLMLVAGNSDDFKRAAEAMASRERGE